MSDYKASKKQILKNRMYIKILVYVYVTPRRIGNMFAFEGLTEKTGITVCITALSKRN